jgi:hypothetical protein
MTQYEESALMSGANQQALLVDNENLSNWHRQHAVFISLFAQRNEPKKVHPSAFAP